jgi:phosphatidate cytidylyltransferase
MLAKRVLTALILAPAIVLATLFLSTPWFSLVVGLMTIVAGWEYCNLINLGRFSNKSFYIIVILAAAFLLSISPSMLSPALYAASAWWMAALFLVINYPKSSGFLKKNMAIGLINGLFLFIPMAASLAILHSQERSFVLLLLFLIWAADSGAYFSGMRFGSKKLCPQVSPNKTFEGVFGGMFFAQVVAIGYAISIIQNPSLKDFLVFCFLGLVVTLFSIIGDLFESVLKRVTGQKDSGNILPGHGGLLDRIDSLTASAPIFLMFIMAFEL